MTRDVVRYQNRLLTRAAPMQSHDRKGVVTATIAQDLAVMALGDSTRLRVRSAVFCRALPAHADGPLLHRQIRCAPGALA